MKTYKDFDYKKKTVILRCDFNVTIKEGKILSDEKIIASLPTIKYLIDQEAKIILLSHLGKVKSEEDKEKNSLYPVYEKLCNMLPTNVYFSSETNGSILESKIDMLKPGEVLLVENTRYEDIEDKKESSCSEVLSKYWASKADIFINDAFGMTHRKHASNYGIAKYLPHGIGLLIEKEVENLNPLLEPSRPFTIIMGGAKVSDKLDIIKKLLPKCDYLLVGGGIANSFLNCNYNVGNSLKDDEKKEELQELLNQYSEKIILPEDVIVLNQDNIINKNIDEIEQEDIIYDIGEKTLSIYKEYIDKSKTIFLNGTVGMYEDRRFENGTKKILNDVSNSNAIRIIGGGDALASAEAFNNSNFDYISTGGGATLEYIASGFLECLDGLSE